MERIEKRLALLNTLKEKKKEQLFQKYNLTREEYEFIVALNFSPELTVDYVQKKTHITKETLLQLIDSLTEKELIKQKYEYIYLTDKGKSIYSKIKKEIRKTYTVEGNALPSQEYHQFIHLLDKLIDYYE